MCLGNFLTFHGSVLSEEGKGEREEGGTAISSAEVLQRLVLLSLRKHFITLPRSLPLSLLLLSEQWGTWRIQTENQAQLLHTHTYSYSGCCAEAPSPPSPSFTLRHFPLLSHFWCPVFTSTTNCECDARRKAVREWSSQTESFFFGKKKGTHTLAITLWSPSGECVDINAVSHTHTHSHTCVGADELTLYWSRSETWSKCGLLQVLWGEREAGEEQEKAKKDTLKKEKNKE